MDSESLQVSHGNRTPQIYTLFETVLILLINFLFWNIVDFHKSCRDSTVSSHMPLNNPPLSHLTLLWHISQSQEIDTDRLHFTKFQTSCGCRRCSIHVLFLSQHSVPDTTLPLHVTSSCGSFSVISCFSVITVLRRTSLRELLFNLLLIFPCMGAHMLNIARYRILI